jgi:ubiquinone/menaquinone biosynthesis C-methylase UbiE
MKVIVFLYKIILFFSILNVYYYKKFTDIFRKKINTIKFRTEENVLKNGITHLYINKKTNLKAYCNPFNTNFFENMYMDVTQGSGYDYILEENATLSNFFWLGNHERSISHSKSVKVLDDYLNKKSNEIKILDIGCGSGTSIIRLYNLLKKRNISFKIYACDIYDNILVECIHNLTKKNIDAEILICNGEDLPYQNDLFDIVINYGSINQFNNIQKGLNEMIRVVKDDGICICRDEHYNDKLLNNFEKNYFNFIKNEKIPYNLLPVNHPHKIIYINKIHFLLVF